MKKTTTHSTRLSEKGFNSIFIQSLFFFVFFFGIQNSFAQKTWDGGASTNNWNDANNWSGNSLPGSSDNVVIGNGATVVFNTTVTVASLTVGGGTSGSLTLGNSNTDRALTVTGNVTVNAGATITSAGNGGNDLTIGGNLSNAGTFTDNGGLVDIAFNGGSQTISGAGTFTFTNFLFSTSGAKTINSSINVNGNWTNNGGTVSGTGTVVFGASGTIGGSSTTAFPNLTVSAGTISQGINTTVSGNYNQTGGTYVQNTGATAYSLTVTGNFTMSGSSLFRMQSSGSGAGATTTVNGATGVTLSGTASIEMDNGGAPAANVSTFQTTNFTSSSTANSSTGIIDFGSEGNTKSNQFRISGNCTKTGSTGRFYTSASVVNGGFVFNGPGTTQLVSIAPFVDATRDEYYGITINNGAVVQLTSALKVGDGSGPSSSMTVNGTLDTQTFTVSGGSVGTFTLGSGATLKTANINGVSGTSASISTSFATESYNSSANYIFNGAANQTANFGNATMNDLTISNTSGSVTLNAAITVNDVVISTGGSLTGGSVTHLVSGNWTNNGTFVPGAGTINFNFLNQVFSGTAASANFNNVIFSGGGTKDFSGKQAAISGNLSIASGTVMSPGSLTTHTAGTITLGGVGGSAAKYGSTSTSATPTVYKTNTYFTSGTTGYITVSGDGCTLAISTATIASNNATTTLAKNGDVITVSFTTSETPSTTPTATINGVTATVSGSGTSYTATRTVSGDSNGLATFSLSIQNAFGCTATRTTVTNASSVTVDTVAPTIPTISIASNNANTSLARAGNVITVSFTTSETPSATPTATISGGTASVSGSGTSYTATRTVLAGDTNGVAPFSISIRDAAGNTTSGTATTNSSSVTIDTAAPTIPTGTIASNNANTALAKAGDVITVSFTTSETPATTPTVTISGGAASVSGSGTSYTATRTTLAGDTNGVAPFSISIADAAGNTASRTATTNSSSVTVDTAAPTIPTATIVSNNATTNLAKAGDVITLSFTTSQTPASTPTVTISGGAASVSGSGTSYTATRTVLSGDANGVAPFSITIADAAGNSTSRTTTTNSSSVTVDTVAPTFSTISIASNNANTSLARSGNVITLSFTTSQTPSATPTASINGFTASVSGSGTSWTATRTVTGADTNGVVPFSISIRDAAGNTTAGTATTNSSSVTVDTLSPTIPTASIASDNANSALAKAGDVITVSFTTSETPAATPTVTISGGAAVVSGSGTSYTATRTTLSGDTNGVAPFSISIADTAGNTASRTTTTNSSSVTVDTVAPTIPTASIASNNANTTRAKAGDVITLTFTTSQTPAVTPTVTISGGAAVVSGSGTSYTATRTTLSGDTNGIAPFSISISDAAGNTASRTATTNSSSVTVDTAAPTFPTVSIASNNANPSVAGTGDTITLSFTTSEALLSTPSVTIDGSAATVSGSGTSWSATKLVGTCSGTLVTFTATVFDLVGNSASTSTTTNGSSVTINPTPSATIVSNGGTICSGFNATFTVNGSNGATLNYTITGQVGTQQLLLTGINQIITASNATADVTLTLGSVVNANCSGSTFATGSSTVTVNPLPVVTASDVSGCAGTSIALVGSPIGGNFSVANPYVGTSSTTYTYSYTDSNGCSATSAPANITITPQPLWYLDADGDHYYTGAATPSCTSPGAGYTLSVLGGGDCNDGNPAINPGAVEICYNNIDDNCDGSFSEGCTPVVVNMTASYNNSTLPSLSIAVPAVEYTYSGSTNLKYRFSIKNLTTGITAPDIIQTSRYVTIPASIHSYNSQFTIKASAVINDEVVAFAGNTITVNSPSVQLITLNTSSCGATLAALTTTITANAGLNALGYTFRIRLNDGNPSPTYAYSESATRFVGANTFTGFPLQYSTSYKIAVQYTFTDPITSLPVQSGYGAECTVNTPSIPLTNLASPTCGSQVAAMNANISAAAASYATSYQFRIRLFTDNGPNPTYYYSVPNASRFSSLTAFQGITFAYNTNYAISVQYSVLNGSSTVWSGYGAECKIKTPFFPVTSLIPSQCGLSTATSLTQQLNISPYPGFPHYRVKLEEISGEDVVNFEEREITYPHFKLSDFSIAQEGKIYNVSVAIKLNGVFGDYDTACDLFTASNEDGDDEGGTIVKAMMPFKAVAYPNPFADNFMLDIKTNSQSSVNLKVYDMLGRLMEQRNISVSEMQDTTIGSQYPSGVYNVVVSQGDSVETVRVVKR
ncbi:T9SS type A sorting domain-containing protein [Flavobacterium wongokense]|uniref:T9SS type A sorting domain-containing protein n=1 Tax=Flavobacterium wongokense TaxID=2910674 RepID=UPI001F3E4BAC|nr:T9SS type A sorting domain-containing protein [Flavobacterium sp. WG47]MCF6132119.1 T9SS type A sorting domain-containing protein [Flavobacterium sp. WG47]